MKEQSDIVEMVKLLNEKEWERLRSVAKIAVQWAIGRGLVVTDSEPTERILRQDLIYTKLGVVVDEGGVQAGASVYIPTDRREPSQFEGAKVSLKETLFDLQGGGCLGIDVLLELNERGKVGNTRLCVSGAGQTLIVDWIPSRSERSLAYGLDFFMGFSGLAERSIQGKSKEKHFYLSKGPDRLLELMVQVANGEAGKQLVGKSVEQVKAWVLDYLGLQSQPSCSYIG